MLIPLAIACAVLLGFGCLMQYLFFPDGWMGHNAQPLEAVSEIASTRGVIISEVMTSNKSALSDENNLYTDWIEIGNNGRNAVDISGWSLTDKLSRTNYFTFPEGTTVAPGQYLIVYASGQLKNQAGSSFHAPFKLSSTGDTLILSDESGTVVESINIPTLIGNQSYARRESGWQVTMEYTPGLENTSLSYAMLTTLDPVDNSPLLISEISASNASYAVCADGSFYDWIEIQNVSAEAIDLSGYGLSDNPERPSRWRFPAVILQPSEFLVVYASGLDMRNEGEYHTNFRLRAEGESVLLYNAQGQLLDYLSYENLKEDQSYARQGDTFQRCSSPTPGKANQ